MSMARAMAESGIMGPETMPTGFLGLSEARKNRMPKGSPCRPGLELESGNAVTSRIPTPESGFRLSPQRRLGSGDGRPLTCVWGSDICRCNIEV